MMCRAINTKRIKVCDHTINSNLPKGKNYQGQLYEFIGPTDCNLKDKIVIPNRAELQFPVPGTTNPCPTPVVSPSLQPPQILSVAEKNWNKEFQALLELPPTPDKYTQIRHLSQEFLDIGKLTRSTP